LLVQLGFIVPSAEIAIALGLLTRRFRDAAAVTAVLVHAFVLIAIGPLGQSWNFIVWPWNVAMAAFSVILFYGDETSGPRDILALARPRATLHALVVVLFCLAPALSFVGLWDSYLSAALYSRNVRQAGIKVSEAVVERLPAAVAQHVDEQRLLWPMDWSFAEMNVPVYPEPRVFKAVARAICEYGREPDDVFLVLASRPEILTGTREVSSFRCADLR